MTDEVERHAHPVPGMVGRPVTEPAFYDADGPIAPRDEVAVAPQTIHTTLPDGRVLLLYTEGAPMTAPELDALRTAAEAGVVDIHVQDVPTLITPTVDLTQPRFRLTRDRDRRHRAAPDLTLPSPGGPDAPDNGG